MTMMKKMWYTKKKKKKKQRKSTRPRRAAPIVVNTYVGSFFSTSLLLSVMSESVKEEVEKNCYFLWLATGGAIFDQRRIEFFSRVGIQEREERKFFPFALKLLDAD